MMEKDFYLGRILTGRVSSGVIHVGDRIHGLRSTDSGVEKIEEGKVCGSIFVAVLNLIINTVRNILNPSSMKSSPGLISQWY